MKGNQNCHDFAQAQTAFSPTMLQPVRKQLLLPTQFKRRAKVIDAAEQFF
jgi:hypothetical protein